MTQRMLLKARYEGIYTIVFLSLCQAQYGVVWSLFSQSTGCRNDWVRFAGRCYIFKRNDINRTEAFKECANYNARMVTSKTNATNNFLMSRMNTSFAWLGLKYTDGSFKWSDGRNLGQFFNWNTSYHRGGDYVLIEKSTGQWRGVPGSRTAGNICSKRVIWPTGNTCVESAIGMESEQIPDANISASSQHPSSPAHKGRLGHSSAWCSRPQDNERYMQINLSATYVICAIATQGHLNESQSAFVDKYRLQYSVSGYEWEFYKTDDEIEEINGNTNHYEVKTVVLQGEVIAKMLRIWHESWLNGSWPCMRVEIYGNKIGPPGPPEYLQVLNTSYNYVIIHWKPPPILFSQPMSGYIVRVEKLGNPANPRRMMFSSCQSKGINVTGLEENSMYCVFVTTFNRHGKGSTSSCFVAVTGERARVEFTALNQSSTSIRLEWKPDLPDFLPKQQRGFKIDYFKATGGNETRSITFLNCENRNSYLFSNLSVFANYCYNFVSFSNEEIDTKKENYKCAFTDEEAPLGPPLNITAQNASSTSINVTWRPIAKDLQRGIIQRYRITYKKQQDLARRKRRSIPTVFAPNTLTWILEGLEKFTNYCMQIEGYNSKGYGNKSEWICVPTDESVPSVAPNITEGYNTSVSSLHIEWTSIPALRRYAHGYLLGYMIRLTRTEDPHNHIFIETESNELSKDIEDLRVYTTYCVRVAGRTRIGPGNWSDCRNITTDDGEQLYPPVNVKAISKTSTNTMDVTWDPPLELQGRLIGYKVQFENLLEDGTYQTREVMVCSPNTTLTGLQINTRYRVRVAAGTRRGFSPFSELSEGETCSCPETLPISAKPSSLDDGQQSLSSIIESLVEDVCGECRAYDKTKLVPAENNASLKFPVVMSHSFASTGSKFVAVIEVPGLAVVRRKTEPDPGAMEKVMGFSVFSSWPIFALSGILTILAGLLIWMLDVSTNPEEFPPQFYKGAGNGFWWAFITMTTLGYGDRTPKSDPAKAFAMIWFLVGLVVFSLFSAGLTSDLTVVVSSGGPTASGASSKAAKNIATLRGSAEKDMAVRKLMTKFNLNNEYDTIEELVKNLENGSTDAILVDMYTPVKRKDLFNGSWFEVAEIVKNEISHGIILEGEAVALAKNFQELIRDKNVQTKFLTNSEEEEEHAEEHVEESGLVFFEPASPFYSLTIKVCGGLLGALMLFGCIFEAYKWKYGKKEKQSGRLCQDEDEMRELVEEFYRDFTRVYKRLRKKAALIIKLKKTQQESACYSIREHRPIKLKSNFEDAKLW